MRPLGAWPRGNLRRLGVPRAPGAGVHPEDAAGSREIFPIEVGAEALAVLFALAQICEPAGPVLRPFVRN